MHRKIAYQHFHTIFQNVLLGCLASSEHNANQIQIKSKQSIFYTISSNALLDCLASLLSIPVEYFYHVYSNAHARLIS
jgi:hypothetical protein